MNLLSSEKATNFKTRRIALASATKIELADGNRREVFNNEYILKRWQDCWDQQIHNLLHELHCIVGKTPCSYGQNPKEQVVLTRCRIGHHD
jgi:hypothetical protein